MEDTDCQERLMGGGTRVGSDDGTATADEGELRYKENRLRIVGR